MGGNIKESLTVIRDGKEDPVTSSNWDDFIESYLPSRIAHLFFFDGEQIANLAEGGNAGEILGSAIRSLLGVDLIARLENDLRTYERKKAASIAGDKEQAAIESAKVAHQSAYEEEERLVSARGEMTSRLDALKKSLAAAEQRFKSEGGELWEKRESLQSAHAELQNEIQAREAQLRDLAGSALPFALVADMLDEVKQTILQDAETVQARTLKDTLEQRDDLVTTLMTDAPNFDEATLKAIEEVLANDRMERTRLAERPVQLHAPIEFAEEIDGLLNHEIPTAQSKANEVLSDLSTLREKLARLEDQLTRVPADSRLSELHAEIERIVAKQNELQIKCELVSEQIEEATQKRVMAENRLRAIQIRAAEAEQDKSDVARALKHSKRARATLEVLSERLIGERIDQLERLITEAFNDLTHKTRLVSQVRIDTKTFEPVLLDRNDEPLPIERLSAGERQLLATSMLWGLARAAGRPVPTVIDTPLGRLDSGHRKSLTKRYFPKASHQVILLSTDEEIVGQHKKCLDRAVADTYLLAYDAKIGATSIQSGYFQ